MTREISAGIIVYRKTEEGPKFLILYHGHNYWNFAKGKIESEERSFDAALREIKEETGLTRSSLVFARNFRTYEKYVFWRERGRVYKTVIFYLAETTRSGIKLSDEHEGYGWFTYKETYRILARHKDSQLVLRRAYAFLSRARQRNAPTSSEKKQS